MRKQIPITTPYFDERELQKVKECLDSGWVTQGPMVQEFERLFRDYQRCKYSVAVSSCTAALHIAVMALGLKENDEVIVPAYTWITSASCAEYVGAKVRFVDVEKETMNIDPLKIEEAVTERTKAIVAVHLFGNPARMDEIMSVAEKHHLRVIEDCACAIGTKYKGKRVGTIGDIGCFSFHPRKAITTGEGGMCSTNDEKLYERLLQYRNHGANAVRKGDEYGKPYYMGIYDDIGYNLRLSDIQAAVGVAQFEKIDMLLKDRQDAAKYYIDKLHDFNKIILPTADSDCEHMYQSFVILLQSGDRERRNYVMDKMQMEGIQTRPGTIAITRTEYNCSKYGLKAGDYPIAEFCEDASITLPIYPFMERKEQDRIIKLLRENI